MIQEEMFLFYMVNLFCNRETFPQIIHQVMKIRSEVKFRDNFMSGTILWKLYHYWNEKIYYRCKKLQTVASYSLRVMDSLLKILNCLTFQHFWDEHSCIIIWHYLFSKYKAFIFGWKMKGPFFKNRWSHMIPEVYLFRIQACCRLLYVITVHVILWNIVVFHQWTSAWHFQ